MPLLDVSDVLDDPDFQDSFSVTRNEQVVGNNGVATQTPVTTSQKGVVTMDDGTLAKRLPELERVEGAILVHTRFRLTDGTTGAAPGENIPADIITWPETGGRQYTVHFVDNYSRYGAGFICAICTLRDLTNSLGQGT